MRREVNRQIVVLAMGALLIAGACKRKDAGVLERESEPDFVTQFDEQRLDAAIAEARETLGMFEAALDAPTPGASGFAIKKGFRFGSGADDIEYIWLSDVRRVESGFLGRIDNEPVNPIGVKLHEEARVARADVADWMFIVHGRLNGGYTIVALAIGSPKQAEYTQGLIVDWDAYKFLKRAR